MDPIRIIVVGCGGNRGAWFVGQLARHSDYRVTALVDRVEEAAQVVAEHYGLAGVPVYPDTAEALGQVPCDAVLIATPDGHHVEPVVVALERGKHVYVEKPLAITLEDCLKIVRADREAGGRTMVGFNLRFAPLYSHMRQMIAEGAVGRVLTIQTDEFYYGGRTYFRRWNRLRRNSGGLWITKACHDFDQLYWLADAWPVRVSASARLTYYVPKPEAGERCSDCPIEPECPDSYLRDTRHVSPLRRRLEAIREAAGAPPPDLCLYNSEKDTFDHGIAQVEFENDALAVYTLNVVAPFTDRRVRIGGTEATMEGQLSSTDILYWRRHQVDRPDQAERISLLPPGRTEIDSHGGGDVFLLDDFAAFVRGQPSRAIPPAEASVAVAIGLAATQASDANRTVEMAEIPGWEELRSIG
ncbi:MAG: Gfo/Idh/MocA family oxidoreductase [Chloroflexi bacterium]|nr:Gfo/Idh/MocA family oxidoreductase [Chloroflexota bacterium]